MKHSLTVALALCGGLLPMAAQTAPLLKAAPTETLPSTRLRGYGNSKGR